MQFRVLQLFRNALPSHFLKHLVACFVCEFIFMRKDLRHPHMCAPLSNILYAFQYFSPGYKHIHLYPGNEFASSCWDMVCLVEDCSEENDSFSCM